MPNSLEHRADTAPAEQDPAPAAPMYSLGELVEMYSRTVMLGVGIVP